MPMIAVVAFCCLLGFLVPVVVVSQPTWQQILPLNSSSPWPEPREDAVMSSISSSAFLLYGGCTRNCTQGLGDTWMFSLSDGHWINMSPASTISPVRWGAAATTSSALGVLVFGGTDGVIFYGDLWSYNLSSNAWTKLTAAIGGVTPTPRAWASFVCIDPVLDLHILFGGDTRNSPGGPVQYLKDANTFTAEPPYGWNAPVIGPSSPQPSGVAWSQVAAIRGQQGIVLFGGCDMSPCSKHSYNQIWAFDYLSSSWKRLQAYPGPVARFGGFAGLMGNRMVMFGGLATDGTTTPTLLNDLWALSTLGNGWSALATGIPGLSLPSPRAFSAGTTLGSSTAAIFGGYGGSSSVSSSQLTNDLWILSLPQLLIPFPPIKMIPLTVSNPISLILPSKVPTGQFLNVTILASGSDGTQIIPPFLVFSEGEWSKQFCIEAGSNGLLLVAFALSGPGAASYLAPESLQIDVQVTSKVIAPPILQLGNPVNVELQLADAVPVGEDLTVTVSRKGQPAATVVPHTIIMGPMESKADFNVTAFGSLGNLSLYFSLSGSASSRYFIPELPLTVQGYAKLTLSGRSLTRNAETPAQLSIFPPLSPGQSLNISLYINPLIGLVTPQSVDFAGQQHQQIVIVPNDVSALQIDFSSEGNVAAFYELPKESTFAVDSSPLDELATKIVVGFFLYFIAAMFVNYALVRWPPKLSDRSTVRIFFEAYFLWLTFGIMGAHRFFLHKPRSGGAFMLTVGMFGFGWIIDGIVMYQIIRSAEKGATFSKQTRLSRVFDSLETGQTEIELLKPLSPATSPISPIPHPQSPLQTEWTSTTTTTSTNEDGDDIVIEDERVQK